MKFNIFLNELDIKQRVENAIRDHLSETPRKVTKEDLFSLTNNQMKVDEKLFDKVFNELVKDDFLVKSGRYYKWEK